MPGQEELRFLLNPSCVPPSHPTPPRPSSLSPHCPSSGGPAWPSLGQQRSMREQERGWNVLKAETFLIVHSHRPYVTQTDHVTQLCSGRGKPQYNLCYSGFVAVIWLCKPPRLHNTESDGRTDSQEEEFTDRMRQGYREDMERERVTYGWETNLQC